MPTMLRLCLRLLVCLVSILCTIVWCGMTWEKAEIRYLDAKYLPTGVAFKNVSTNGLSHCVQHCHQSGNCMSLFYDGEADWCGMVDEFFNFPQGTEFKPKTSGLTTFVELSKDSWSAPVLRPLMNCSRRGGTSYCHDNVSPGTECLNGFCVDDPCFNMTSDCADFGADFVLYKGCELRFEIRVRRTYRMKNSNFNRTVDECKEACRNETRFTCQSFDFRSDIGMCSWGNYSKCTHPTDFHRMCREFVVFDYYHRTCIRYSK